MTQSTGGVKSISSGKFIGITTNNNKLISNAKPGILVLLNSATRGKLGVEGSSQTELMKTHSA